jgi:hypothetical protein
MTCDLIRSFPCFLFCPEFGQQVSMYRCPEPKQSARGDNRKGCGSAGEGTVCAPRSPTHRPPISFGLSAIICKVTDKTHGPIAD